MTERTFGEFLRLQMIRAGNLRPADIERETGLDASLVGKWMRDKARPSPVNLARLAPAIDVALPELLARSGHVAHAEFGTAEPPEVEEIDPLVVELSRMLDPNGGLSADKRHELATLVDRVISPYRRDLRKRRAG